MNTKKDFEATARIIRGISKATKNGLLADLNGEQATAYLIGCFAEEYAHEYARNNPQFKRALFFKACGMEGSA
jgi:hypothetical protein